MLSNRSKLGEMLVAQGVVTDEQLAAALKEQVEKGTKLGETLVARGALSACTLVKVLADKLGVKGCCLRHGLIDPVVARMISREDAERLRALPMFKVGNRLTVAMAQPQDLPTIDRLQALTGCEINPVLALESNLAEFTRKYHTEDTSVDSFLVSLKESDVEVIESERVDDAPVADVNRMVEGSPVINLVNLMILTAIRDGASDIHVEPGRDKTRIRYRIDGVLRELMAPPAGMHAAIVSRIKVIGKMDIAEKRLPQEGRVHIVAEGREVDLRVSSMPTILGEKVVLRILDKHALQLDMESLGLVGGQREAFRQMLLRPHGLVLVTGPTGSGKTTTLYAALELLRSEERNIVTVEDPVEYQLDSINQIQVHEAIGLTFPRALRSILRQDPDVVMVGEIRDEETARVAMQAALTGHLVLSTLHTNDTPGALVRLFDMGLEPYLVASALNGVVAQRLARTVCPDCRTSYIPAPSVLDAAGRLVEANRVFYRGQGCRKCHDTGFRGRAAIFEIMTVDDGLRQLIHDRADEQEIRRYLRTRGWRPLREEGLRLAEQGRSTLEEVLRVTFSEQEMTIRAERAHRAGPPAPGSAPVESAPGSIPTNRAGSAGAAEPAPAAEA